MSVIQQMNLRQILIKFSTCLVFSLMFLLTANAVLADSSASIHLLTLPGNSEAVLLESRDSSGNPVFGMVDTGEDNDYPDGSDPRYPSRFGTIIGNGNDEQVYAYLNAMGVNRSNLQFIVCTHPHSDHIGLADSLIRDFAPDYVYLPAYADEYISNENRLWDNLYIYDQTIAACQETEGVTLIQSGTERRDFSLGSFRIQIVNNSEDYQNNPKPDANQFCLGVIAKANGHTAFLSSDIDNIDGDEDQLVSYYGLHGIDLLISNHHGYSAANSTSYLAKVAPKYYLQDGTFHTMTTNTLNTLSELGSRLYSAGGYYGILPALIVDFSGAEAVCNADNTDILYYMNATYVYHDGLPYYGALKIDEDEYCTDEHGKIRTNGQWTDPATGISYEFGPDGKVTMKSVLSTWVQENGKWYYRDAEGNNITGWTIYSDHLYYLQEDGVMATGWLKLDGTWYYFASWGGLMTGWQKIGGQWYYLDPENRGAMIAGQWFLAPDGYYYLMQSWGGAYCNTSKTINGITYSFNKSCRVSNPTRWLDLDSSRYLLTNGKPTYGWASLSSGFYYLNTDGTLKRSELFSYKGHLYYVDKNGVMASNKWVKANGSWYYMQSWGGAYSSKWLLYNHHWYWLEENCVMATGWREIDGVTYYFNSSGAMVTGKVNIDGIEYEFASSGALKRTLPAELPKPYAGTQQAASAAPPNEVQAETSQKPETNQQSEGSVSSDSTEAESSVTEAEETTAKEDASENSGNTFTTASSEEEAADLMAQSEEETLSASEQ